MQRNLCDIGNALDLRFILSNGPRVTRFLAMYGTMQELLAD